MSSIFAHLAWFTCRIVYLLVVISPLFLAYLETYDSLIL